MSSNRRTPPPTLLQRIDEQADILFVLIVSRLRRIQLSDTVIGYVKLVLFVAFAFMTLAAIITFSFHTVMGAIILGVLLGFMFYQAVRD